MPIEHVYDPALGPGYEDGRWCADCGHCHAVLYVCEHYSDELKAELEEQRRAHRAKWCDREWVQAQLDAGMSPDSVAIFRAFAGLETKVDGEGRLVI